MDMLAWYMANRAWSYGTGHERTWRQVQVLLELGEGCAPSGWGDATAHARNYASARSDKDHPYRDQRMDAHREAFDDEVWKRMRSAGVTPNSSRDTLTSQPSWLDKLSEDWEAAHPLWKTREALHLRRVLNPRELSSAYQENMADKAKLESGSTERDMPPIYYVPPEEFFARVEQQNKRNNPDWRTREQLHKKRVANPAIMSSKIRKKDA